MTDRAELHKLLDRLPDDVLPAVERYLEAVYAGCPPDNPWDDEPLSPEAIAMIETGRAEIARGDVVSHEEVGARLAARQEPA